MTAADRTPECYTQCAPRLTRLRLLARGGTAPLPPGAAGEVGHAARAIVAETGAGGQAAVAAVAESRRSSAAVFLAARQARLAAAAEDLVAAAAGGSAAALSRPLRRFEMRESARLEAAFPLGDGESLQPLQQRCHDVSTRPAGCSALLDASLPAARTARRSSQPARYGLVQTAAVLARPPDVPDLIQEPEHRLVPP